MIGTDLLRVERDRALQARDRLVKPTRFSEDVAEKDLRCTIRRIERYGVPDAFRRRR